MNHRGLFTGSYRVFRSTKTIVKTRKETMNNNIVADKHLQDLQRQFQHQDEGALLMYALSFLDVKILLQKETVNKTWQKFSKGIIDAKYGQDRPLAFQSNEELKLTVVRYCKYEAVSMEEIACRYGYPIDRWDVSHVHDMSTVFDGMRTFNEYIGSWDVSNVTNMSCMFERASCYNQDIGSWDVSNVTDMSRMFYAAGAFNQDVGSWDVSDVTNICFQPRHWVLECVQCHKHESNVWRCSIF
jgi:hypothetical protein